MTLQRVDGRADWWNCHHKVNGKVYSVFAGTIREVLELIAGELKKDDILITKQ